MKEFIKKHRVPIIVVASLVVLALIVTGVLLVQKPKSNKGSEKVETTTTENSTTESAAVVDDGDNVTTEEWVILVAQKFGFNSYISSSPYFEDVKDDSNIFPYVQTMVENEILDAVSGKFGADEEISQKSALIQLSKIYGDTYIENRFEKDELTEEDYINFAIENIGINLTAIEDGFTYTEATDAINKTWEHYLSKEYGNFEKIEYTENVIDLSSVEDYVYENNTVLVSTEQEITEGKVLIFATKDEYKSLIALKVTAVEKDGNNYILDVTEPTLDDIVVSMNVEFSQIANWDNFIPAEGVTVLDGESVAASGDFNHTGSEKTFEVNFTDKKLKYSDEWEDIHGKLTLNGINIDNVNYFKDSKGNMMSKYKEGVEIVGKITIKDLIIKGYAEYDGNLEFNVESGATISSSLSIKGKKEEQMIRVGELPIHTFGSPFSFVVDVYVVATMEGEIKVEPKVTAIASAKKTKNSGVNFTGDITTSDLNSTISGKVKLAVCPDAVVCLYGLADLMDLYIEAGVGSDAKYDLKDPGKIKIEIYAPTLKAGVGKDKKSILSGVLGIKYEVNIMDKKDALFKCPYIEELVFDVPAIIDYITGEETTIEEPTEPEIPTEPITEAPNPTEPVTQKPTEAPVPTEPVTEAPNPTEPALPQYELSGQTYEWAGGFGDNYYLVKVNGLYGVVDFYGNVKIPIQYEDYNSVGNGECEFVIGNMAYIYDIESCKMVYQFANVEEITNPDSYQIVVDEDTSYVLYNPEYDGKYYVHRQYNSGLLIETLNYIYSYSLGGHELMSVYTFIDAKSGNIILKENGLSASEYFYGYPGGGLYVSTNNENEVVLLSSDINDRQLYMCVVTNKGYEKKCIDSYFGNASVNPQNGHLLIGGGIYNGRWLKFPWGSGKMFNISTCEWITMPYSATDMGYGITTNVYNFYYGRGSWYGANTSEGGLYDLVKGSAIISTGFSGLNFSSDIYIRGNKNDKAVFIDYNTGHEVKWYDAAVDFDDNGIALVDDGVGLCYVDTSFNRVSEYIYTGDYDNFTYAGIKINGRYHLIQQK